jgi:hypothetical protein
MDLRPCTCGETVFSRASAIVELDGDELGSRYDGECAACGSAREFLFRLPAEAAFPPAGVVVYGDGTTSELLDPGEWLWVADRYALSVSADTSSLEDPARAQVRVRIGAAAAAMDEVLAFVPAGADAVPSDAVRSELGRAVYEEEPGRFERERLEVVRDTYRALLLAAD